MKKSTSEAQYRSARNSSCSGAPITVLGDNDADIPNLKLSEVQTKGQTFQPTSTARKWQENDNRTVGDIRRSVETAMKLIQGSRALSIDISHGSPGKDGVNISRRSSFYNSALNTDNQTPNTSPYKAGTSKFADSATRYKSFDEPGIYESVGSARVPSKGDIPSTPNSGEMMNNARKKPTKIATNISFGEEKAKKSGVNSKNNLDNQSAMKNNYVDNKNNFNTPISNRSRCNSNNMNNNSIRSIHDYDYKDSRRSINDFKDTRRSNQDKDGKESKRSHNDNDYRNSSRSNQDKNNNKNRLSNNQSGSNKGSRNTLENMSDKNGSDQDEYYKTDLIQSPHNRRGSSTIVRKSQSSAVLYIDTEEEGVKPTYYANKHEMDSGKIRKSLNRILTDTRDAIGNNNRAPITPTSNFSVRTNLQMSQNAPMTPKTQDTIYTQNTQNYYEDEVTRLRRELCQKDRTIENLLKLVKNLESQLDETTKLHEKQGVAMRGLKEYFTENVQSIVRNKGEFSERSNLKSNAGKSSTNKSSKKYL